MKKNMFFLPLLLAIILIQGCTKESVELGVSISVDKNDVVVGEPVTFTVIGEYEFLTYYKGVEGRKYENYPNDLASKVFHREGDQSFVEMYDNINGTVTATFVATSYGNLSEDVAQEVFHFEIVVSDKRTGIDAFIVKFGRPTRIGIVDNDNHKLLIELEASDNPSLAAITLVPISSKAKVFYKDETEEWVNGSILDLTAPEPHTFRVLAADGETKEYYELVWSHKN